MVRTNALAIYINDKVKQFYFKNCISSKSLIDKRYKKRLGRQVKWENPVLYNDKLQWLKLNWRDPLATQCADKYEVRSFIEEKIGDKYLNPLLGVYETVEKINLEKLPESFVLKGTHGSGFNIIVEDKNKLNWDDEFRKMRRWLRTNYYLSKREWVYKDIKPRIVCEKFLSDETGKPPMDYKIFCFHGEPKLIQVDVDRFGSHQQNFYNTDWSFKDIQIEKPSNKGVIIKKPDVLEEMLDLSRELSKPFPHVRVDFYVVKDQIIFGELTFFHHSGMGKFKPQDYEKELGSYLTLPEA